MIYLDVTGRCGNQLFQYAFALKLIKLNPKQKLHISFYNVERWRLKTGDDSFDDQLKNLNIKEYLSDKEFHSYNDYYSLFQKMTFGFYSFLCKASYKTRIRKISDCSLQLINKVGIYCEENNKNNKPCKTKSKNIFVKGYFENPCYFEDIKAELTEQYTPKYPRKPENSKLYDVIEKHESVCVSFRAWNEVSSDVARVRDVCGRSYYQSAIEIMHKLHPNAVYIVFSNDIPWVKSNFVFPYETYFESGNDEIWEKLRLMYSCKHFIISPSTFAWWAQFLSGNGNKTVISPAKWANDPSIGENLISNRWVLIDSEGTVL